MMRCRFRSRVKVATWIFIPASVCLGVFVASHVQSEPPSLDALAKAIDLAKAEKLARIVEADMERARLDMERARLEVKLKALAIEEKRKAAIGTEREKLASEIQSQAEYNKAVRQWAVRDSDLNTIPRSSLRDGTFSPLMQRWAATREITRREFTVFPEKSGGAVISGRALNFFLYALGRTAVRHEKLMTQMRAKGPDPLVMLQSELRSAEEALAVAKADDSVTSERCAALTGERESAQARLMVWNMCEPLKITSKMQQNLKWKSAFAGPKLRIDAQQGVLPLDWPVYLRGSDFNGHTKLITRTRAKAIEELQANKVISSETQQQLMAAVDDLDREFNRNHRPRLAKLVMGSSEFRRIFVNVKFIKDLRSGVCQFFEYSSAEDVAPVKFESNSLPELLAVMLDKGYLFDEVKAPENIAAHQQLFEMMSKYYADLYGLQIAVSQNETNVEKLRANARQLAQEEVRETSVEILNGVDGDRPGMIDLLIQNAAAGLAEQAGRNLGDKLIPPTKPAEKSELN